MDDYCYICDDAYSQKEIVQMEVEMLKTLEFDIGVPISYTFLRRYARVSVTADDGVMYFRRKHIYQTI